MRNKKASLTGYDLIEVTKCPAECMGSQIIVLIVQMAGCANIPDVYSCWISVKVKTERMI